MKKIIITALLLMFMLLPINGFCGDDLKERFEIRAYDLEYVGKHPRWGGSVTGLYVITDKETGREYLCLDSDIIEIKKKDE